MKILQVHNKYKITGGEWTVLNQEYDLLSRDHTVDQLIVDNNEMLNSIVNKLKLVFSTHYNSSSKELVKKKLEESRPDVMHVHNFFPLLSPSIFEAAREAGVPSVLTLHNYRLIHPNGMLYHNGQIDERSISRSAYTCVLDAVYRDSVLQTAVVAYMIEYHRKHGTWDEKVDCFICLTEFAKSKFIDGGLPEKKIKVKPNFVADCLNRRKPEDGIQKKDDFYLYIGRISEEKGIQTILKAWDEMRDEGAPKLVIVGDGPIKAKLQKAHQPHSRVEWAGFMTRDKVMEYLMKAKALLFPSEWYEGMPMAILEAFSACTPVISSNIGTHSEIVEDKKTGLHFNVGSPESLINAIQLFEKDLHRQKEMSLEARREYEQKYTPEINYEKLMAIYKEALRIS